MIYGIGTDLVSIERMRQMFERWHFKAGDRILAPAEMPDFMAATDPAAFLAKRFAVKEAFAKALGTGIRDVVTLTAIAVDHDDLGKPIVVVSDELQQFLVTKGIARCHVSISDEKSHALAFVVLEQA